MNYYYEQFGKHFEKYCQHRLQNGIKQSTLEREFEHHIWLWRWLKSTDYAGDELTLVRKDLQNYAYTVFSNQGITSASQRNRLKRIKMFYQTACSLGWMIDDPTTGMKLPKEEKNPIKTLSVKQVKAFLELPDLKTVLGIRDRAMLEVMYSSGLRREEVLNIKADDFAEDYRTIRIKGKGDKEVVLPVGKMAAHFLRFYVENIWGILNTKHQPYLFLAARSGKRMGSHPFYQMVRAYAKRLDLNENIGPHVFRFSVCTHLSDEGVDIRLIQDFMRHDKISTTGRYIKQSFEKLAEVHHNTHPRN